MDFQKIDKELLDKYNVPVPRYTSYPPANHFREGATDREVKNLIGQSNQEIPGHVAFYIHIPFCRKICFYCGCNACTVKHQGEVENYIQALKKEIREVTRYISKNRKISQIHFGGGTPNAIDARYIREIVDLLGKEFIFIDQPEIAIECNPAYLDKDYIDQLLEAGFNRFSLGVQDLDENVLNNVNRQPSFLPLEDLMAYTRSKSSSVTINLDFIYGLPGQTTGSFARTISGAAKLKPERLVTFSYAHVPWLKKHQEVLEKAGLPEPGEKMQMFLAARNILVDHDYQPIGLDHYVLPGDELNEAFKANQLHRNFQGYCTRKTTGQVYAFGASSISQLQKAYIQNTRNPGKYMEMLSKNHLPTEKVYKLSREELIIKDVITELMCNARVDFVHVAGKQQISLEELKNTIGFDPDAVLEFVSDGLVNLENEVLTVTETGALFIRNIAAFLDPAYNQQKNKYSKSV